MALDKPRMARRASSSSSAGVGDKIRIIEPPEILALSRNAVPRIVAAILERVQGHYLGRGGWLPGRVTPARLGCPPETWPERWLERSWGKLLGRRLWRSPGKWAGKWAGRPLGR